MNKHKYRLSEDTSSEKMATMSDLVNHATKKNYNTNFTVNANGWLWDNKDRYYNPEEVTIDDFYRFEGESDPADNAILYLVSTIDGSKGVLIDAYGVYEDANASEFIRNVSHIQKKKHQLEIGPGDLKRYIAAVALLVVSSLSFLAMARNKKC